jgi:hypothetical protein
MLRKAKTSWKSEGNLAPSSDLSQAPHARFKRPTLRLVQGFRDEMSPLGQPVFRPKQLVLAMGVSLTLCLLWILLVFILYRLARTALAF